MEVLKSFLIIIVVVLSFGVAVIAGQNGLLSARCAARCLTEHKDSLRGRSDRNNHRKFKMLDRCKNDSRCFECMKPCSMSERDIIKQNCDSYCKKNESLCQRSCRFLAYIRTNKAGDCPRPETAVDFEAVCLPLPLCGIDGDCSDNKKCCPNRCNYACREPTYDRYDVPTVPANVTLEEKRQGKALRLTWILPNQTGVIDPAVYVLEARNTTKRRATWGKKSTRTHWHSVMVTQSRSVLLREIHGGHWYQFRVAMVTASGSRGYSPLSKKYKSSKGVQKPLPPRNITEGATTLHSGQVDVTLHWEPPAFSDLPVWKYKISYNEMLSKISPVLVDLPVLEARVQGHVHKCKLKKLKPGKTYRIQIEAVIKNGKRELRSKRVTKYITTYAPPNYVHDKNALAGSFATLVHDNSYQELRHRISGNAYNILQANRVEPENHKTVSVYEDIIRVEKLEVADKIAYFDKGSLKARLTWTVGEDFLRVVKSFMIYWEPHSCDQDYSVLQPYSATSDAPFFEVYDLQFECVYNIRVNAVTKSGVQGRPTKIRLRTPVCNNILVKANSLPPDCPDRDPQVPRSPKKVSLKVIKKNCSIDLDISWRHPRSDLPIHSYLLTYEIVEGMTKQQRDTRDTDGPVYKPKPVEINLERVNMYLIRDLNHSEVYRIKLYANSSAGLGEPAFIEILTPMILPCGSDKDPEPPDTTVTREVTPSQPTVFIPSRVIIPVTTATKRAPPPSVSTSPSIIEPATTSQNTTAYTRTTRHTISIHRTVYYLWIIFEKLVLDT